MFHTTWHFTPVKPQRNHRMLTDCRRKHVFVCNLSRPSLYFWTWRTTGPGARLTRWQSGLPFTEVHTLITRAQEVDPASKWKEHSVILTPVVILQQDYLLSFCKHFWSCANSFNNCSKFLSLKICVVLKTSENFSEGIIYLWIWHVWNPPCASGDET